MYVPWCRAAALSGFLTAEGLVPFSAYLFGTNATRVTDGSGQGRPAPRESPGQPPLPAVGRSLARRGRGSSTAAYMRRLLIAALVTACFSWPSASLAQPNGCSLGLRPIVQHGLDHLVAKACERHDLCWQSPSTCAAPTTFADKARCDLWFLADLEAVCSGTALLMAAAGSSKEAVEEFREDCRAAALLAYTGVSLNLRRYAEAQCRLAPSPNHDAYSPTCSPPMCRFLANNARDVGERDAWLSKADSCCPPDCPDPPPDDPIVTCDDC